MAANACPGRNLIDVPAGRFPLTLNNDLEITEEVTIIGAGRDATVVEDVSSWGVFAVQHGGGIDHMTVIRQMTVEKTRSVPCIVVGHWASTSTPPSETVLLLTEARLQNCRSRDRGGGMRIFKGGYAWLIDVDVFGNHASAGRRHRQYDSGNSKSGSRASAIMPVPRGELSIRKGPYSPPVPATNEDMLIIRRLQLLEQQRSQRPRLHGTGRRAVRRMASAARNEDAVRPQYSRRLGRRHIALGSGSGHARERGDVEEPCPARGRSHARGHGSQSFQTRRRRQPGARGRRRGPVPGQGIRGVGCTDQGEPRGGTAIPQRSVAGRPWRGRCRDTWQRRAAQHNHHSETWPGKEEATTTMDFRLCST